MTRLAIFANARELTSGLNTLARWLPLPLGLSIFGYIVLRAVTLSMTHDEASTYLSYVQRPVWEIVTYAQPTTANNHILNTLLVKFFTQFGDSEWLIRLPNVLAGGAYLWFAWLFSRRLFRRPLPVLAGFVFLCFNPYLLEFFGLARGYGLCLGFMMGSLYFVQKFLEKQGARDWAAALVLALLAVYSNFTLLNYFVCLLPLGLAALWWAEEDRKNPFRSVTWRRMLLIDVVMTGLLILLVAPGIYTLVSTDELYFAGQHGFFRDTYYSLVQNFIYRVGYLSVHTRVVAFWLSLGLLGLSLLATGRHLLQEQDRSRVIVPAAYAILLLLAVLSLVTQYYLFGTLYVRDRMALYFYPLLAIVQLLGLRYLSGKLWIRNVILIVFTLLLLNHFYIRTANLRETIEWWYDQHTRGLMVELNALGSPEQIIRFGGGGAFQPAILYYQSTGRFPNLEPIFWAPELRRDTFFDYYLVFGDQLPGLHPDYEVWRDFNQIYLMKCRR